MDLPERVRDLLEGLAVRLSPASIDLIARALEFDPIRRQRTLTNLGRGIAEDLEAAAGSEA